MRRNAVLEKSYSFALGVVRTYRGLVEAREYVLSRQLVRAGTSIGANVEEAMAAQSRRDFIGKLSIARKEARECGYWIRLLRDSGLLVSSEADPLLVECTGLIRLLTAIIMSTEQTPEYGSKDDRNP
jgi:four helix bundle protein